MLDLLLYADGVKRTAPRHQMAALQSSLEGNSKWSEDWELILNPFKSDNIPTVSTDRVTSPDYWI